MEREMLTIEVRSIVQNNRRDVVDRRSPVHGKGDWRLSIRRLPFGGAVSRPSEGGRR